MAQDVIATNIGNYVIACRELRNARAHRSVLCSRVRDVVSQGFANGNHKEIDVKLVQKLLKGIQNELFNIQEWEQAVKDGETSIDPIFHDESIFPGGR